MLATNPPTEEKRLLLLGISDQHEGWPTRVLGTEDSCKPPLSGKVATLRQFVLQNWKLGSHRASVTLLVSKMAKLMEKVWVQTVPRLCMECEKE